MTSPTPLSGKRALTIGINNYPNGNKLNHCIVDATDVKTKLESIEFDVMLGTDCNKDQFDWLVNRFIAQIQARALILIYFAGHGVQFNGKNLLLPAGYTHNSNKNQQEYIEKNSIDAQNILQKIQARKPYATVFILDCCRFHMKTRDRNEQLRLEAMRGSECFIVFSCGSGQGAIDDTLNGRNGAFVGYLLKYLAEPKLDIVTILEKVTKDITSKGFPSPWYSSCLTNKIYLAAGGSEGSNIFSRMLIESLI